MFIMDNATVTHESRHNFAYFRKVNAGRVAAAFLRSVIVPLYDIPKSDKALRKRIPTRELEKADHFQVWKTNESLSIVI